MMALYLVLSTALAVALLGLAATIRAITRFTQGERYLLEGITFTIKRSQPFESPRERIQSFLLVDIPRITALSLDHDDFKGLMDEFIRGDSRREWQETRDLPFLARSFLNELNADMLRQSLWGVYRDVTRDFPEVRRALLQPSRRGRIAYANKLLDQLDPRLLEEAGARPAFT